MSKNAPVPSSDTSMSSRGTSHVKTLAKQENEPDSLAIARAFGLSSPVLLAKFDHDTWLPRMSQASLLCPEQWEPLSGSWPDSAMWDAICVYELRTSERAILGSGFSLWPTAVAHDDNKSPEAHLAMKARMGGNRTAITSLQVKVQTWPTARREDGESAGNHPGATDSLTGATKNWPTPNLSDTNGERPEDGKRNTGLNTHAQTWLTPCGMHGTDHTGKTGRGGEFAKQATQWATPRTITSGAESAERKQELGRTESGGGDLQSQVESFFPTPAQRDYRTPNSKSFKDRGGKTKGEQLQNFVAHSPLDPTIPDGPKSSESDPTSPRRLNPRFVEWLMGFPPGWTEL